MTPKELTEAAFHLVTYYRSADGLADGEPEAPQAFPMPVSVYRKVLRPQPFTVAVAARKLGPDGETLALAQALIHRASYG
jgi:hypothetical protein